MTTRYFAVVALVEVTDDTITQEALYDRLGTVDMDTPGIKEIYLDVDPEWRAYPTLAENAEVQS